MRWVLFAAIVACQRGAPEQAVGSGSAPAVLNTQVVGCAPAAALPHAVADGVIPTAWFPYATLGEMCDVLRETWGEYEETAII